MTQMNGTITFETRKLEESITEAVLAKVAQTVAEVVLPGVAQLMADVQRLTKLLEAEAVEPAEMAAVLAHSGAVNIEVATAQAQSLARLGYRLVPLPTSSAPDPVAATWDGPTPPQPAAALRVPSGEVPVIGAGQGPLWSPPPAQPEGTAAGLIEAEIRRQNPDVLIPDESWKAAFE